MKLSLTVAVVALILAVLVAAGYARGAEKETFHDRAVAREAARRVALAEHEKRKQDFARRCTKPLMSAAELEACRAAYRRL
jgi:hypothetical protein